MKIRFVWRTNKTKKKIAVKPIALIAIIFLATILGFFLAEIIIRHFVGYPLIREYGKFKHISGYSIPKEFFDRDLFWVHAHEFMGSKHDKKKPKGVYRVICLGDSVTQSHGMDALPLEQRKTYPFCLEKQLKDDDPGRKYEVINAGVGGYTSLQGLRYLKKKLIGYDPDLVISWFGVNDDSDALFFEDKDQRLGEKLKHEDKSLFEYSKLYLLLKNIVYRKRIRRVSPDDYYKNCEDMLLLARKEGFRIAFVVPFSISKNEFKYYWRYRNALWEISKKYNCVVIDLKNDLGKLEQIDKLFIDNCHATAEGNKIIASSIFESLENKITNTGKNK